MPKINENKKISDQQQEQIVIEAKEKLKWFDNEMRLSINLCNLVLQNY